MTETKPNAELAYRVLDHIDANPDSWDQGLWLKRTDCGTAGCFAGWACMLAGDEPSFRFIDSLRTDFVEVDGDRVYVEDRAADRLGITPELADALFHPANTREVLGDMVAEIFGPRPGGA